MVDELRLAHAGRIRVHALSTRVAHKSVFNEVVGSQMVLDHSHVTLLHREFGENSTELAVGFAGPEVRRGGETPAFHGTVTL